MIDCCECEYENSCGKTLNECRSHSGGKRKAGSLEAVCEEIYPLTIIIDRYNGAYSGGKVTAWNCRSDYVPSEISDDDCSCYDIWSDLRETGNYRGVKFGVGNTVIGAVEDLYKKLKNEPYIK